MHLLPNIGLSGIIHGQIFFQTAEALADPRLKCYDTPHIVPNSSAQGRKKCCQLNFSLRGLDLGRKKNLIVVGKVWGKWMNSDSISKPPAAFHRQWQERF